MEGLLSSIDQRDPIKFVDSIVSLWNKENEVEEIAQRLSEIKEFFTKSSNHLNSKISTENKKVPTLNDNEMGDIEAEFPDLQLLEPRGRFKVNVMTKGLLIEGKSGGGFIPFEEISYFILVPSHTSSKKEGEDYFAVMFEGTMKICGKDMKSILFNLSKTLPKQPKSSAEQPVEGETPLTESEKFIRAVRNISKERIHRPDSRLFRTVSSSNSKSFLRCHKGTQEGAIYPLECGIMFIKPLLFIAADEIASLSAGRGGGSGNTRFVDLKIETVEEKVVEFVNIEREELPALQVYVAGYLERRKVKTEDKKKQERMDLVNFDDDDSEDEDDDYNPDESDSDNINSDSDEDSNGSNSAASDSEDDKKASKKSSKKRKNSEKKKVKKEVPKKKVKKEVGNNKNQDQSDSPILSNSPILIKDEPIFIKDSPIVIKDEPRDEIIVV